MDKQIEKMMLLLHCTEEEARTVIEDDKKIDKGEKLFELSKEQKQVEKKMRSTGTKVPTVYKFDKKTRKADEDKKNLLTRLADCVRDCGLEVLNPEREFVFTYNGRKFKVTLSAPRS